MVASRAMKSAMEPYPESHDSPYITVLAFILLMFSVYLLYHHFTAVQNQDPVAKKIVEQAKPKEHLVRVITLPPKPKPKIQVHRKPKAKPKAKVRPKPKPKARPSAVSHASVKAVTKGAKPAIDATFAMPIERYLTILKERTGARVLLFDSQQGHMIGEVDGDQFIMGDMNLNGMSMQARDITSDLPSKLKNRVLNIADAGAKPYKFLIVLPTEAEQRFEQLLAEKLRQHGIRWSDVSSIQLKYREWNHHIMAQIKTATVKARVRSIGATIRVW